MDCNSQAATLMPLKVVLQARRFQGGVGIIAISFHTCEKSAGTLSLSETRAQT